MPTAEMTVMEKPKVAGYVDSKYTNANERRIAEAEAELEELDSSASEEDQEEQEDQEDQEDQKTSCSICIQPVLQREWKQGQGGLP